MKSITENILATYPSQPSVAILMSGRGSNAEALLASEAIRDLYDIKAVITDSSSSRAKQISEKFKLRLIVDNELASKDTLRRGRSFNNLASKLDSLGVSALFYAGFMTISPAEFCHQFPGTNVHPANLTIKNGWGTAKYTGLYALSNMVNDLGFAQSSVHAVDTPVDTGDVFSVSEPVDASRYSTALDIHEVLKNIEHVVYPRTLELLGTKSLANGQLPIYLSSEVYL